MDGVVVALDFLKSSTDGTKCQNKKVVLISDLGCASNPDKLDTISKAMRKEGVEFMLM